MRVSEEGRVVSVEEGIAWIEGLPSAAIDELLLLDDGSRAQVFHLTDELVGALLLGQTARLGAGTAARHSGEILSVPVGDELLGRVIDPLGVPLDGQAPPACTVRRPVDMPSPPLIERDFVTRPLETGVKIVDTMIPIGKGQRQLIVGDNGLGKSALAVDIAANQRGRGVLCVYVLIGQKRSSVVDVIDLLRETGALATSVVVVAEATRLPGLAWLAPFSGCAIAEAWMRAGRDTLVVYDDLTAHADAYRQLSLLLRRPPGREAYPADIFFLHSRLLERATCLQPRLGGGSLTALPIIETKEGEIASYIPTNLISITDGQIYLDERLFAGGFLPAIDIGRSVSRIGGAAQPPALKREAARMKLDYLQFLELEVFTRFGARIEPSVRDKIARGRVLRELLKQDRT
ncbi:MAG TPA: F0F1 ATP synthase subunit alpha, partial [Ideonella sp.]|nr:F0F1 ATP synthase subunit alpha [Ideonella sp.]